MVSLNCFITCFVDIFMFSIFVTVFRHYCVYHCKILSYLVSLLCNVSTFNIFPRLATLIVKQFSQILQFLHNTKTKNVIWLNWTRLSHLKKVLTPFWGTKGYTTLPEYTWILTLSFCWTLYSNSNIRVSLDNTAESNESIRFLIS